MGKQTEVIEGFGDPNDANDSSLIDDNRLAKNKKIVGKKCGGFQGMGLSLQVIKGIQKRGYKVPTPIQRKTIPLVLEGRDVVGMARTGSGKTACFLIPMFEKLKARCAKTGARAIILSPTRELALQTHRFIKELGRFMDLKSILILGGDAMEQQFEAVHGNPDIIVATPGRFLHLCVEMDLKLSAVEYVVFDEADRLFEMGFGEQLSEILARLPDSRQTVLFSATLPKILVEFARAGLSDPVLLRLDVDTKIPETLKLGYIFCCSEEKPAALLLLLRYAIPENSQTVVFVPTKHHVDYLYTLVCRAGYTATFVYSDLDPSARKINAAKFVTGKAKILIVTDVAARGLDIPCLDIVINFNFPPKPKLFVHRVGRCARAGRSGIGYSLVTGEEKPYLLDLHLFLGRPLVFANRKLPLGDNMESWESGTIGKVPQELLEEEDVELIQWHENSSELVSMKKVCSNAYKQFLRSRPGASNDSVRRAKELLLEEIGVHPGFFKTIKEGNNVEACPVLPFADSSSRLDFLKQVRSYRPTGTVFEIGRQADSGLVAIMREKRQKHDEVVKKYRQKVKERNSERIAELDDKLAVERQKTLPESNAEDIDRTFTKVIAPKRKFEDKISTSRKKHCVDKDHYIHYSAPDHHTEQGLSVNSFEKDAAKFELDVGADTENGLKLRQRVMKWDQRKKKMVHSQDNKTKKIRTESGVWIPATYKSGLYNQWKEKSKVNNEDEMSDDELAEKSGPNNVPRRMKFGKMNYRMKKIYGGGKKNELKKPEQILKQRKIQEMKKNRAKKKKGGKGKK